MKTIKLFALMILWNLGYAQTLKTTYYDWNKTKKMEVYQVDANGERNGTYKNYDEDGALRNTGNFKSGKRHGTFIEYVKFPNYAGTMQIKSKVTYVNDVLEGLAIYYAYDEFLGVYESFRGYFKNDKEQGKWARVRPFSKMFSGADVEKYSKLPMFKNCMALKDTVLYDQGSVVKKIASLKVLYYPSNKIYRSLEIDSTYTGTDNYFYPDGKVWSKKIVKNDRMVSMESFYPNGKLQSRETANPEFYEGYNEDGTPDNYMLQFNARKKD
jgi:antitoxin component YwqK of YwqJK toxin-antitoxin module